MHLQTHQAVNITYKHTKSCLSSIPQYEVVLKNKQNNTWKTLKDKNKIQIRTQKRNAYVHTRSQVRNWVSVLGVSLFIFSFWESEGQKVSCWPWKWWPTFFIYYLNDFFFVLPTLVNVYYLDADETSKQHNKQAKQHNGASHCFYNFRMVSKRIHSLTSFWRDLTSWYL